MGGAGDVLERPSAIQGRLALEERPSVQHPIDVQRVRACDNVADQTPPQAHEENKKAADIGKLLAILAPLARRMHMQIQLRTKVDCSARTKAGE